MQSRVDRQLRALALAKACAACGARVRTIGHLTGLPPREVVVTIRSAYRAALATPASGGAGGQAEAPRRGPRVGSQVLS